jgi:hypothetical protein
MNIKRNKKADASPELPKKEYEKPQLIWEDDFKAVTYAAVSCAKKPLHSGICDSRPVT